MTKEELKEQIINHGKTNVLNKDGTIHVSPILALAEDIKLFNELKRKSQISEAYTEIAKVIAENCAKTQKQIHRVEKFFKDYDEVLSGQQYDPVNHWMAKLVSEKESEKLIAWLEEKAKQIADLRKEAFKDDASVRKSMSSSMDDNAYQPNTGMFIIRYNPSDTLIGSTPSNDYGIEISEKDNIASVLRKTIPYMQEMLDEYFGIDEVDKNQRIFISHQQTIDATNAYCTVIYTGYNSENEGEVAALVQDQFSHAIDTKILMLWNDEPYAVTATQIEHEKLLENVRKNIDAEFIVTKDVPHVKQVEKHVTLHDYSYEKTHESYEGPDTLM